MTKKNKKKKILFFGFFFLFILAWGILLYYYPPQELVALIGARNGYFVMFLVALFGGATSFSATSYFAVLLTLAAGGLNPFLLGIVSGLGVTVGDSLFYYLGSHGRASLGEGRIKTLVLNLSAWLDRKPKWFTPALIYLYAAFTPLPNDFLAITMGLAHRRYITTIVPLVLG
ncbi:MAG: hypothetical protein WDZ90_00055, partial [Candidatus Paceibacterota bacterium]